MKAEAFSMEVTAQIVLTKRELLVLNHIARYDCRGFAEQIETGGIKADEIVRFMDTMRDVTYRLMKQIETSKESLFKAL
jgi:hypothetical protein